MPVVSVTGYRAMPGELLFPDTNVWLARHGHVYDKRDEARLEPYVRVLDRALRDGVGVRISPTVCSEYVSAAVDIAYRSSFVYDEGRDRLKEFRATTGYRAAAQAAAHELKTMLRDANWAEVDEAMFRAALPGFVAGQRGMADGVILETCRRYGFTLLTADGDFLDADIKVVTKDGGITGW